MLQRPDNFRLNIFAPSAQGLVFAGLGFRGSDKTKAYHDSSLYGNHGTLTGMDPPTDWVFDPYLGRWVLDFDGTDDYVVAPVACGANMPYSIGMWMKLGDATTEGVFQWANSLTSGGPVVLLQRESNTQYRWLVNDTYKPSQSLNSSVWVHVAVTYDSSVYRFYSNGAEIGTHNAVDYRTATSIWLGNGWNGYAPCTIGDLIVANSAWPVAVIQGLADPSNVMLSGLILPPSRKWPPVSTAGGSGTTIDCTLGEVVIAANAATIETGNTIDCTKAAVEISALQATIETGADIACTTAAVEVSGLQATIEQGTTVDATTAAIEVAGLQAAIEQGTTIDCTTAAVEIAPQAASIVHGSTIDCQTAAITVSGLQAEIVAAVTINATTAAIVVAGCQATIDTGSAYKPMMFMVC